MSTTKCTLTTDRRSIVAIYIADNSESCYRIGQSGITRITVDEAGQMGSVPWFSLWKGEEVWARINSAHVELVEYEAKT